MPNHDSISVEEYVGALKRLPEWCQEFLVIQFQLPRHQASSGQLATLMGRRNQVNLPYGRLGHLVFDALNISKPSGVHWFEVLSDAHHNGKTWIWIMRPNLVAAVKQLGWAREQSQFFFVSPEELPTSEEFTEGKAQLVAVNIFERNQRARAACLHHYGFVCAVCGFDFEKFYGELGREFIHVHHIKPLAEIGEEYTVDPIKDLQPVCPNCHAMLHRKIPALVVDELKDLISNLRASAPPR